MAKVDILNQLGYEYRKLGLRDSSLIYIDRANKINDHLDYPEGKIANALNYAITFRELKMYAKAKEHNNRLIDLCEAENDLIRKGDAYDNLAHIHLEEGNTPLALKNHFIALRLREKTGDSYGIGNSCDNIAHIYSSQYRYQDALKYFMRSLNVFKKIGDLSRETLSSANVGLQLFRQGNYPASLLCYYHSLENYNSMENEEGIAWMYRSIGEVLAASGNVQKAMEYYNSSLSLEEKLDNKNIISEIYSLMGKAYIVSEDFPNALDFHNKALKISESKRDVEGIVRAYYFIAKINLMTGNLDQALTDSETSIALASKNKISYYEPLLSTQIGEIKLKLNQPKEAKKWLVKALDKHKEMETGTNLFAEYKLLSEAEAELSNFQQAFQYHKMSVESFERLEIQKASQLASQYETDKKETLLRTQQEQKNLLNSQELNKKQIQRNTALFGLVLMALLSISLLYLFRYRSKKIKIERQNLVLKRREAEAIQETEKFKSKFIANISHEFRTVLTLIKGHIEVLNQDLETGPLKPLQEMNQNGDRLLELVNQLLDLSKIENGKYVLIHEEHNLLEKLKGYVFSFESYAARKSINFQVKVTDRAQVLLEDQVWNFSPEAVQIIVSNLLSNAIKFTPSEGDVTTIIDFDEDILILSVSDSGTGITEKDMPHVFDRFYQIESSYTPEQKGSGIGLSLVKELAVLHQGDAEVINNPEKGCCFTVYLKCDPVEDQEITEYIPTLHLSEKPLILVVEDQAELRRFICNNIGDAFESIEASNGKEGILLAEKHLPDLIISDVMMPKINGFELCQHLKNTDSTSHIPIILLSGMTDQSDKIKGMEMGADAYLSKPFSVEELRLRIKNVFKLLQSIQNKFKPGQNLEEEEIKGLSKRDFDLIKKLKATVEEHISDPQFSVGDLAEVACLSQSQLTRKLKAIIGQTPSELIKNTRLTKALELLREESNVSETAWAVGFEDSQYFSKVFKKHFGVIPSEYYKIKKAYDLEM